MKYFMRAAIVTLLILAATTPPHLFAQSHVRKRFCTVNLIEGGPMKGNLVVVDAKSIIIEVEGVRRKIKLDNVTSIVFTVPLRLRMADEPASRPGERKNPPE